MKTLIGIGLVAFAAFALPSGALAAGPSQAGSAIYRQAEARQAKLDVLLAPIHSRADLDRYLASTPAASSPLDRLSLPAKKRFLASLRFGNGGLASFRYDDLEAELTATDVYQILSLFGMQHMTSLIRGARIESPTDELIMSSYDPLSDWQGYQCSNPGECEISYDYVCNPQYCTKQ